MCIRDRARVVEDAAGIERPHAVAAHRGERSVRRGVAAAAVVGTAVLRPTLLDGADPELRRTLAARLPLPAALRARLRR